MIITEQMGMSWATEREDFTFKIINKIIRFLLYGNYRWVRKWSLKFGEICESKLCREQWIGNKSCCQMKNDPRFCKRNLCNCIRSLK